MNKDIPRKKCKGGCKLTKYLTQFGIGDDVCRDCKKSKAKK